MSTVTGAEPLPKLRLVDGCELLGRYGSAAFEQPQYLIRRADDQLVRLSEVLYLLASHLDGSKDASEMAEQISADLGRPVSPENVCYLVKHNSGPTAWSLEPAPCRPSNHAPGRSWRCASGPSCCPNERTAASR